jgi:glycosyltransferase involved in cell wall biosynthesis
LTQERGIARYVTEQIRALVDLAPQTIAQVDVEPGAGLPARLEGIEERVPVAAGGTVPVGTGGRLVYNVMSPFDPMSIERIWPAWAQQSEVGLAVTMLDLIPLLFADSYLAESGFRAGYMVRLGIVRVADVVMAISQTTAGDAIRHLDLDPERVVVIGAGCSELFRPSDLPVSQILEEIRRQLPGIRPGYLLYTGAADHRKNIVRLVEAYGELPLEVRREHQLVLAGNHDPRDRRDLVRAALKRRVQNEIVFTGRVSDELLLLLYHGCLGLVFPSLYEGFGLPVLEAMSAGAAVIASDIPVLAELVTEPDARFDPRSTAAIAAGMMRLIREPKLRARLQHLGGQQARRNTWTHVATRSLAAYEVALNRRSRISAGSPSKARNA